MQTRGGSTPVVVSVLALALAATASMAESATDRELELLQKIQLLEQRLNDVEKHLDQPAQESIEARVARLETQRDANVMTARWRDGLRLTSQDGDFEVRVGGRIHNDWIWATEDKDISDHIGKMEEGVRFRRARINIQGKVYNNIEFKSQYDFAGDGDGKWRDVYLGLNNTPIGSLKVGQFKEPFALEELTSSNYITFIERSLPVATFSPSRNTGVMASGNLMEKRMTYALGVFRGANAFGDRTGASLGNEWNFTGRLTGLPYYEDDGKQLVHLGLGLSHRNPPKEDFKVGDDTFNWSQARYRARPETSIGPRLVDSGVLPTDSVTLVGAEAAAVFGPFSAQAEFIHANVDGRSGYSSPNFHGWYAQASYFLTGEHRPYSTSGGNFGRVKPKQNAFDGDGGMGAWEVGLRYSRLDLDSKSIRGGELDDITVGLNWYLNPNTRWMLNYTHAMVDRQRGAYRVDDSADILAMRFQIDF